MVVARYYHAGCLLDNGNVFVSGGVLGGGGGQTKRNEIYNTATGEWREVASSTIFRYRHSCMLLPSGEVFICGGENPESACEIYSPSEDDYRIAVHTPQIIDGPICIPIYE
jgi:hypothetical protein